MVKTQSNILSQNKKAFVDFEVLEKIEAGIELTGAEVKSVRAGHANLKGSYIEVSPKAEAFTRNIHISPYKNAPQADYNPTRKRRLLLHKKEILKLQAKIDEKGTTVVPLDFHLNNNRIKLTIGICKGKKKHDRRDDLKKKSQDLEIRRSLKKYG